MIQSIVEYLLKACKLTFCGLVLILFSLGVSVYDHSVEQQENEQMQQEIQQLTKAVEELETVSAVHEERFKDIDDRLTHVENKVE